MSMTSDYTSRKRINYKNKAMNLASTFRNASREGKNNGRLISDDDRL